MRLFFTLILCLLPGLSPTQPLAQDRPEPGLMWNRTGLPAVFPLQVKTNPGTDYIVTLITADTGTEALAAYITGGKFFRVLVPPGTYRLRFEGGVIWHTQENRFADPEILTLKEPLTFGTKGLGRKAGHLVDLTALTPDSQAAIKPQVICRLATLDIQPNDQTSDQLFDPGYTLSLNTYSRFCD